ncbi:hypothetical protein KEM56_007559 [Ascosphaera pollenicola]|nr:hypothetical protein KEM56_007559 [Ascosphaera pollenicola]
MSGVVDEPMTNAAPEMQEEEDSRPIAPGRINIVRSGSLAKSHSTNVFEVLQKGLDDLMDLCDAVTEKFTIARDQFNAQKTQ